MEQTYAAPAFATLGHPGRLAVFRLLMRFAPQGVRPTEIATALGLKQNTLSHHLADLTGSGLVRVDRQGRSLFYSVALDTTAALIGYLALDVGRARPDLVAEGIASENHAPRADTRLDVLFLCTGNSARSIFAEALLRDLGAGRFRAFSAGTQPGAEPNRFAIDMLGCNGHAIAGLRPKPVSDFQRPGAIRFDFVLTVCDTAAAEECPPWPGQPISGHWGVPDPVKATGTRAEQARVFAQTYAALRQRVAAFVDLPFGSLSRRSLQSCIDAIGTDAILPTKGCTP